MISENHQVIIDIPEDMSLSVNIRQPKHLKGENYCRLLSGCLDVALDKNLSNADLRVFMVIQQAMGFDNCLFISHQQLANLMSLERSSISRSIKALVAKNCLRTQCKVGTINVYFVNPYLVLKAYGKSLEYLQRCWDERLTPSTGDWKLVYNLTA